MDIGLASDIGTLARLPKLTGNQSLVHELAYTARPFSANEAEKMGLVSKVVEGGKDEVVKAALETAKVIAAKSPIAIGCGRMGVVLGAQWLGIGLVMWLILSLSEGNAWVGCSSLGPELFLLGWLT